MQLAEIIVNLGIESLKDLKLFGALGCRKGAILGPNWTRLVVLLLDTGKGSPTWDLMATLALQFPTMSLRTGQGLIYPCLKKPRA
jgi:hypothetical protein